MHFAAQLLAQAETAPPSGLLLAEVIGLFVFGSLFGSFANVVVYRLPRGKSLLHPPSHCPRCGHAIRWYDNVPVFGWLWLGGRCRDCRNPISSRYPLVEALFGLLFALVGGLEFVAAKINLPPRVFSTDLATHPHELALAAFHLLLLGTLVVAALIEHDRQRIPRRLLLFALALGFFLPVFTNGLRPVAIAADLPLSLAESPSLLGLIEGLAGIAAGLLLGSLARPLTRGESSQAQSAALLELVVVGAFLGWQAVCGVAVLAVAIRLLRVLIGGTGEAWKQKAGSVSGWSAALALATVVWISGWSLIVWRLPIFGSASDLWLLIACGGIVALIGGLSGRLLGPAGKTLPTK